MKISVFGLGYVGCVSAACLARDGHEVVGVDVNEDKVEAVAKGQSPVGEPGLAELVTEAVADGRLTATTSSHETVHATDLSFICVGTPSQKNGNLDLRYVEHVCEEIGVALATKPGYHTVAMRSTVLPGTIREVVLPTLERASGKKAGPDFGLAMNPEFLREGTAINDYDTPSMIVIGEYDERSGQAVVDAYAAVSAHSIRVDVETAEMIKYVNNAFHALKITFANEMGILSKVHAVDGREVMAALVQDTRLNISPAYLRPGFAFGGSCLPKDVRALTYRAKERDVEVPLLRALMTSNRMQVERVIHMIEDTGYKRIGVLGLSFKAGTDDVRESPAIPLVETLVGRGYELSIFDEDVRVENLIGANRQFLEREIPHIASLMTASLEDVVSRCDVLVVANDSPSFSALPHLLRKDQILIDLVGIDEGHESMGGSYEGVCW